MSIWLLRQADDAATFAATQPGSMVTDPVTSTALVMPLTTMIGDGLRFEAVLVPVSSVPGQMSLRARAWYGARSIPHAVDAPNPAAGRHGPQCAG